MVINVKPTQRINSLKPLYAAPVLSMPKIEGVAVQGAELANIDGLRGVLATKNIAANNPIVEVDGDLVLQVTNNREGSPFPSFCSQSVWNTLKWDERLAMKLLHLKFSSKSEDRALQGWVSDLPQRFSTPFDWNENELKELQYEALYTKVQSQRDKWRASYALCFPSSSSASAVSFEEFCWALQCVNSRAFSGPYEGSNASERRRLLAFTGFLTAVWPLLHLGTYEQSLSAAFIVTASIFIRDVISLRVAKLKRYVICPVVDMFNHRSDAVSDASCNYFTGRFQLFTGEYSPGEQIFVSYGKQSNDRLLQYYGFVEPSNPHDVYDFNYGFIDLLFKYADDLAKYVDFPVLPDVKTRLQIISAALQNTMIQNADDNPNAAGSRELISAIDFNCRYFRTVPIERRPISLKEGTEEVSVTKDDLLLHYDDVTVRAMRAFLCSPAEWELKMSDKEDSFTLRGLEVPMSMETEQKLVCALRKVAALELSSKATTLEDDMAAISIRKDSSLQTTSLGFESKKIKKGVAEQKARKGAIFESPDPSGIYRDRVYSATIFRMEKKGLLAHAADRN